MQCVCFCFAGLFCSGIKIQSGAHGMDKARILPGKLWFFERIRKNRNQIALLTPFSFIIFINMKSSKLCFLIQPPPFSLAMPTVSVHRDTLFKDLGQTYDEDTFQNLCFDFGIELDDVVVEEGETIFKIDIPANRYDLLCIQGIGQALNTFRQTQKEPIFKKIEGKEKIFVKKSAEQIRPFVVGAVQEFLK